MNRFWYHHTMEYHLTITRNECLKLWMELKGIVLFSCSVVFHSLQPHGLQHVRLPYKQLLKLAQTHVHWVNDAIQPSHPLLSLLLPSIFPSIWVFSYESALCIRWAKYWRFSFSISPSKEYSGLIFFRMDWFDLLVVQWTVKSLLQHHSSKHQFFRA